MVICSGADYRNQIFKTNNKEECEAEKEKLRNAESILVVGAGPTGIETVCYLKEKAPTKKIGLCLRGDKLLPGVEGAHSKIETYIKNNLGVNIHYNTPYWNNHEKIGYEAVINCSGQDYSGCTDFLSLHFNDCFDSNTSEILVNKYG